MLLPFPWGTVGCTQIKAVSTLSWGCLQRLVSRLQVMPLEAVCSQQILDLCTCCRTTWRVLSHRHPHRDPRRPYYCPHWQRGSWGCRGLAWGHLSSRHGAGQSHTKLSSFLPMKIIGIHLFLFIPRPIHNSQNEMGKAKILGSLILTNRGYFFWEKTSQL